MARIRVRLRSTGQTGSVEENEFNPQLFEAIEGAQAAAPTPQAQPQQSLLSKLGGGAAGLLSSIFQGPARFGRGLGQTIAAPFEAGRLGQERETDALLQQILSRRATQATGRGDVEQSRQLSQRIGQLGQRAEQQQQQFAGGLERTAEDVAKGAAGTAAFAVPGGGSTLTRLLGGTAAGGLAGVGVSETGEEVPSALGGAVLGGALAGAGELFSKAAQGLRARRLTKQAEGKVPKLTGAKLKSDPFFVKNRTQLRQTAQQAGVLDTMTPTQKLGAVQGSFESSQTQIQQLLRGVDDIADDTILNNVIKNLDDTEFIPGSKPFENQLKIQLDAIEALRNNPVQVNALKSKLGSELGSARTAISKGRLPSKPDQVKMAVFKSLKESLDTISPQVRQINNFEKGLFDVADELGDVLKKDKPLKFKLPLGADIPLPGTQGQLGAVGQRTGGLIGGILGLPGRGIEVAGEAATAIAGQPLLRNLLTAQGVQAAAQPPAPGAVPSPGGETPVTSQLLQAGITSKTKTEKLQEALTPTVLATALFSGELSAADIGGLQKAGAIKAQPGVAERASEGDKQRVLDGLNSLKAQAGKITNPSAALLYENQKKIVGRFLAKLVERNRISDKDAEFYLSTLPGSLVAQLAPGLARGKIDSVITIIGAVAIAGPLPEQEDQAGLIDQLLSFGQ